MENPIQQETEELRRFREEWRQEVESRLEHESSSPIASPRDAPSTAFSIASSGLEIHDRSNIRLVGSRSSAALDLYTQAVTLETGGNHNAATALYRRAFRLQEDVDKTYYRSHIASELKTQELSRDVEALSLAQQSPVSKGRLGLTLADKFQSLISFIVNLKTASRSLQRILAAFPPPEELSFERDMEIRPFVFDRLPDELLIAILQCFVRTADTRSVERFASICRKARIVTLEPSIWRCGSSRPGYLDAVLTRL
jgi:F-box protein 9